MNNKNHKIFSYIYECWRNLISSHHRAAMYVHDSGSGNSLTKIKMHSLIPWFIYCDISQQRKSACGISSWMSRIFTRCFVIFIILLLFSCKKLEKIQSDVLKRRDMRLCDNKSRWHLSMCAFWIELFPHPAWWRSSYDRGWRSGGLHRDKRVNEDQGENYIIREKIGVFLRKF